MTETATAAATGLGYSSSCIHSGTISNVDVNTSWYNYTLASAGTITGTNNTTTATQSICPKGWTLPNKDQVDTIGGGGTGSTTYISKFSPVFGGYYTNSALYSKSTLAYWWNSEAGNSTERRTLSYIDGSGLYPNGGRSRYYGNPVRCIQSS